MYGADGCVRLERIDQPGEMTAVPLITTSKTSSGGPGAFRETGPLRKNRPVISEQHEQVSRAVVVDIDDRARPAVRLRVELLDEIGLTVEVPIGFATDEDAVLVILFDVGAAVEIAIDVDLGELPSIVVATPDVRPTVAVVVLGSLVSGSGPDFDCGDGGTGHDAQEDQPPSGHVLH